MTTIVNIEDMQATPSGESLEGLPPVLPTAPAAPAVPAAPDTTATDALRTALEISERARLQAMQQLQAQQQQGQQQLQQQDAPKWYSDAEIGEMLESDDKNIRAAAVQITARQTVAQAAQFYENRFNQLTQSVYGTAETDARARYAREFELFGDQIKDIASRTDASLLTSSATWDNLIAYVRGQPGNIEKLFTAMNSPAASTPAAARQDQVLQAGFTNNRSVPSTQSVVVDDITREVATQLGYSSVDEYLKDFKLTSSFGLDA